MAKKSVKVVVGSRTYPLSVEENEEERVMKAAQDINRAIKLLQDNYAVKDMQDLLAMTALQLASKGDKSKTSPAVDLSEIERQLERLSSDLDN